MKLRRGFVSNSSSSSFVLPISALSVQQYDDLRALCAGPVGKYGDSWDIDIDEHVVKGFTNMYNGLGEPDGLEQWMKDHGFPMHLIKWEND